MEHALANVAMAQTIGRLINDLIAQSEDMAYHVASFHQVHEWTPPLPGIPRRERMAVETICDSVSFDLSRQAIQYHLTGLLPPDQVAQSLAHAFLRRRRQLVAETSYCVERSVCCADPMEALYEAEFQIVRRTSHDGGFHRVSLPAYHTDFMMHCRATQGTHRLCDPSKELHGQGHCGTVLDCHHWTSRDVDESFVCAPGAFVIANITAWHELQRLQHRLREMHISGPARAALARRVVFLRGSQPRDVVWCSVDDDEIHGGLSLLVEAKMGCAIADPSMVVRIDAT
jgi:hypothetical protein